MTEVTTKEAQQRLPQLLSAVEAGESVAIRSDTGRIFTLGVQPAPPVLNPDWPGYPHPGSAKGLIEVTAAFNEPLEGLEEYAE